jgi:hypothetical protein
MNSPHLDRLASVSRVLFDGRILEMQQEVRQLKHQLAVKTYGPRELNLALADANSTGLVPVCTCMGCLLEQRFDPADLNEIIRTFAGCDEPPNRECLLLRCFLMRLEELGLTWMQAPARFDNHYPDLDCHVVIETDEMCIWTAAFGRRFISCEHLQEHTEFQKLKDLFELLLEDEHALFQDKHGVNHWDLAERRRDYLSDEDHHDTSSDDDGSQQD